MKRIGLVVAGLVAVAAAAASADGSSSIVEPAAADASEAQAAAAAGTGCGTKYGQTPTWDHVTIVVFENKTYSQIIGNTADAPYLSSLAAECSHATDMNHMTATSLTNYIALTSGYTGHNGGREVLITGTKNPPVWPQDSVSIFEAMGGDAREWAESMPSNCYMKGTADFHVGHSPYQYYTRTQQTLCKQYAVPLGSNNPMSARFNLLIPNKSHDMHGTPLLTTAKARIRAGDNWAKAYIPTMLASPQYQAGNSAIILAWDEANNKTTRMPFIVISPYTKAGGTTGIKYNHYSTLKGIQQMLGVTPLLGHAGDPGMSSIADDPILGL